LSRTGIHGAKAGERLADLAGLQKPNRSTMPLSIVTFKSSRLVAPRLLRECFSEMNSMAPVFVIGI